MSRTLICYLIFICFSFQLNAQYSCDGSRYRSIVFNNVDTIKAIKFGDCITPGGSNKELFMDIYQPVGDTVSRRPVIVYAFGGTYVTGDRTQLAELCHKSAQRGFVAVAIDCRTYDRLSLPDSLAFADVALKAAGDMKAAVRKIREWSMGNNPYRMHSDFIVVGGVSSGAITAMHAAMVDSVDNIPSHFRTIINNNGGFEGNSSNNFQYSSSVQAVLNFSGAIARTDWIDVNDPPVFSAHDDGDPTVPFGNDFAAVNFNVPIIGQVTLDIIYLEGSQSIQNKLRQLNIPSDMIVKTNSTGHVSYFSGNNIWKDSIIENSHIFLHNLICGIQSNTNIEADFEYQVFPNPARSELQISLPLNQGLFHISLFNLNGQELKQWKSNGGFLTIKRPNENGQMYFLTLKNMKTGLVKTHKILFQ